MTKTAAAVIDVLREGIDANNTDPYRQGNVITLPNTGVLVVSGDLHGHRRNFERIVSYADLANQPDRHLVLQEIIHGGGEDQEGGCISYELLLGAVQLKCEFPHRVHFIMGNHDTAFVSDSKVMKGGKEMNLSMRQAMLRRFGGDFGVVEQAMKQFLFSQPLAVKCANRIWVSHSLPGNREADGFSDEIFHRSLQITDLLRPNLVYNFTWGRKHGDAMLQKMAQLLDVDLFVLGHQAQPEGYGKAGANLVILASDHNHGCLLPIDLTRSYTTDQLVEAIVPLASIR
ncbi:MAG: metallophosphoesterase [Sedimentisphaerales bacterium]|nr:metallophosphoesterase [Sedimentisphaerales bacterium]